jgi:hypothetical protein
MEDYMEYRLKSNNYGNISLEIKNSSIYQKNTNMTNSNETNDINKTFFSYEKNFEISFNGMTYGSHSYSKRTLNYSIFLSIFCIIEIYLSADFVKLVNTNDQMALNTDLFTILFHIIWTSLVGSLNLLKSLTRKNSIYEYLLPCLLFLFIFKFFIKNIIFGMESKK